MGLFYVIQDLCIQSILKYQTSTLTTKLEKEELIIKDTT